MKKLALFLTMAATLGAFAWSTSKTFQSSGSPAGCEQGCRSAVSALTKTVTLSVPGMTCPSCPITLKKALSRVDGVNRVDVLFEKREIVVTFDGAKTNAEALRKACENAGYPATVKS